MITVAPIPLVIRFLFTAGVLILSQANSRASSVRIEAVPVDAALSRLSDEALISRLQEERQEEVIDSPRSSHTSQPALASGFPPITVPRAGEENVVPQPQSPVMTELVRRGVSVLPALIQHLRDTRPTGLSVRGPDIGSVGFGDQFAPRHPDHPPAGVNTVQNSGERHLAPRKTYTLNVGELCYGAVGKIVNRNLATVGSRIGHTSVINSPRLYPQLAKAVEADWGSLTPQDHERSLCADLLQRSERGQTGPHFWSAIRKLMFYYPDTGREVMEKLLARTLVDNDRATSLTADEVTCSEQALLIAELAPFHWEGLDATLLGHYRAAAQPRSATLKERFYRDLLAFACARRLVGQGYDAEFAKFFSARKAENDLVLSQPDTRFMRNGFTEANKTYVAFLQRLAQPSK